MRQSQNKTWAPVLTGGLSSLLAIVLLLNATEHGTPPLVQASVIQRAPNATFQRAGEAVFSRVNRLRKENGLREVKRNDALEKAARQFADFMAETDKYGHQADGKKPFERAQASGYDHCIVSENIGYWESPGRAAAGRLATRFFDGWRDSPQHRKNILDPDVTETGVAFSRSVKNRTVYAVQMFGRPRSESIRFTVVNRSGREIHYEAGGREVSLPDQSRSVHEHCRPTEIALRRPDDSQATDEPLVETVRAEDGDTVTVLSDRQGNFVLRVEKAKE